VIWLDVWKNLLNKKIRVVQKDGFVKIGILIDYDANFITLSFDNGDKNYINRDSILSFQEVEK